MTGFRCLTDQRKLRPRVRGMRANLQPIGIPAGKRVMVDVGSKGRVHRAVPAHRQRCQRCQRRRTAIVGDDLRRRGIVVDDLAPCGGVRKACIYRVDQGDRERLAVLRRFVVQNRYGYRPARVPGTERQCAAFRPVVVPRGSGLVGGRITHFDRALARRSQRHHERYGAVSFARARVRDHQLRQRRFRLLLVRCGASLLGRLPTGHVAPGPGHETKRR